MGRSKRSTVISTILRLIPRSLPAIVLIVLAGWAFTGGEDIGERASFAQVIVAIVLYGLTWASIDRADRQIEKAQLQINASQEQLRLMKEQTDAMTEQVDIARKQVEEQRLPTVVVEILPHGAFSDEELVLEIINLSRNPVYITYLSIVTITAYPAWHRLQLNKSGLQSIESTRVVLCDQEVTALLDEEFSEPLEDYPEEGDASVESAHFPYSTIELLYYYGGSGSVTYQLEYEVVLERVPKNHSTERYWMAALKPLQDGYLTYNGSFKEIRAPQILDEPDATQTREADGGPELANQGKR